MLRPRVLLSSWAQKRQSWRFQKTRQTWLLLHMYDRDQVGAGAGPAGTGGGVRGGVRGGGGGAGAEGRGQGGAVPQPCLHRPSRPCP